MRLPRALTSAAFAVLVGCQQYIPSPRSNVPAEPQTPPAAAPKPLAAAPAPPTLAASAAAVSPAAAASAQVIESAATTPASAPPLPPPVPFADAVQAAANSLFSNAPLGPGSRQPVVIDPLVDGISGMESVATRAVEERLIELMKTRYTALELQPFNAASVRRAPWVLIGTFTPINAAGRAGGAKDAFRVCLALADLATGKIVSKGFARALPEGVDITPTRFYGESPAWRPEALADGYVRTCQGTKAGDPIHPVYLDGILASSQIAEGTAAYQASRYREALEIYRGALAMPQGKQLRALNGVYLSLVKLRQPVAAEEAFGDIVDYGLANRRIALRFLFRPGSTGYVDDPAISGVYPMWIRSLAQRAASSVSCLEVVGHTSKTGPEPLNERLSLLRAEAVRQQLLSVTPALRNRTIANGVGSRETLVGLGTDDQRDALDRRVAFSVAACATSP